MKEKGISEKYQNGNLKVLIYFARFLGPHTDFYNINKKEQIVAFLNTRKKDSSPMYKVSADDNHYSNSSSMIMQLPNSMTILHFL